MSWGFFVELQCSLPASEWKALRSKRPGKVAKDWSGFESGDLQKAFAPAKLEGTFGDLLDAEGVTVKVTKRKDAVTVRVFSHRDRSALYLAASLASLLEAVAEAGGKGELALVNDGTYSGEDGVLLTRKAGAKPSKPKALKDYDARLEALTRELAGSAEEEALDVAAPTKPRLTNDIVQRDAFAAYQTGDEPRARKIIEEFIDQGGAPQPYVARMYAIVLRDVVGKEAADVRELALDRLLGICERQRELRVDSAALQEVVAVGNENGRADQTIAIVLQGLQEGLKPASWLVVNTTNSGCRSKSEALRMRLAKAFIPLLVEGSPQMAESIARVSLAELHRFAGDKDRAFDALAAALAEDPSLAEGVRTDADWAPYHPDPRWKKLF